MKVVELNLRPDRRQLRQFGWIALIAFGLIGGLVLWRGGLFGLDFGGATTYVVGGLWTLGLLSGLLSFVAPQANRLLFVVLTLITFPIGFVLSYVILGLIFYGMLTPVGLLFRLIGRDSLHRKFDPNADSYYVADAASKGSERYFRQF